MSSYLSSLWVCVFKRIMKLNFPDGARDYRLSVVFQCFKTWMGRSRLADSGSKADELASHVPFVRLLLDSYFTQRLIWLTYTLPYLLKVSVFIFSDMVYFLSPSRFFQLVPSYACSFRSIQRHLIPAQNSVNCASFNIHSVSLFGDNLTRNKT